MHACLFVIDRSIRVCWHLFCKVNPPTCISTRDRPRYWPGAGVSPKAERPGLDRHSQKLLDRGRCLPESGRSARGWIDILIGYWTGAGVSPKAERPGLDRHSQKLLARGRCLPEGGAPGIKRSGSTAGPGMFFSKD